MAGRWPFDGLGATVRGRFLLNVRAGLKLSRKQTYINSRRTRLGKKYRGRDKAAK